MDLPETAAIFDWAMIGATVIKLSIFIDKVAKGPSWAE